MNRLQAAKDSFYVALRDGVQAANPSRIAKIGGVTRIAVAMESATAAESDREQTGVFYVAFGGLTPLTAGTTAVKLAATVRYAGASETEASAMDAELLAALLGGSAEMRDWSGGAGVDVGEKVYWGMPAVAVKSGARTATVDVYVRG